MEVISISKAHGLGILFGEHEFLTLDQVDSMEDRAMYLYQVILELPYKVARERRFKLTQLKEKSSYEMLCILKSNIKSNVKMYVYKI